MVELGVELRSGGRCCRDGSSTGRHHHCRRALAIRRRAASACVGDRDVPLRRTRDSTRNGDSTRTVADTATARLRSCRLDSSGRPVARRRDPPARDPAAGPGLGRAILSTRRGRTILGRRAQGSTSPLFARRSSSPVARSSSRPPCSGGASSRQFALFVEANVSADDRADAIGWTSGPLCTGSAFRGRLDGRELRRATSRRSRLALRVARQGDRRRAAADRSGSWADDFSGEDDFGGTDRLRVRRDLPGHAAAAIQIPHGRADARSHVVDRDGVGARPDLVRDVANCVDDRSCTGDPEPVAQAAHRPVSRAPVEPLPCAASAAATRVGRGPADARHTSERAVDRRGARADVADPASAASAWARRVAARARARAR